jgi:hypothetical protein
MENKQTAMMQMLEFIHTLGENYESKMHAVLCQEKAIELLEVEKKQIKNDFHNSVVAMAIGKLMTPEQYYKETYMQQDNGKI